MIWRYWKRVIGEAGWRGAKFATGGVPQALKSIFSVGLTLLILYLAGSIQFGSRFNAAVIGLVVIAITCILLFLLGLVIIPPEIDRQNREERDALAARLDARLSLHDLWKIHNDVWTDGMEVARARARSGGGGWRTEAYAWRSRSLAMLAGVVDGPVLQALEQWPAHERLDKSNPEQNIVRLMDAALRTLASERDRLADEVVRERRDGGFSKASLPTA